MGCWSFGATGRLVQVQHQVADAVAHAVASVNAQVSVVMVWVSDESTKDC